MLWTLTSIGMTAGRTEPLCRGAPFKDRNTGVCVVCDHHLAFLYVQAIYSLLRTEMEMVEDLKMVINVSSIYCVSCLHI